MRPISFAVIFLLATTAVAEERAAQLLLPSQRLQPTSTFEVRFAAEMVRPEQLGKPVDSPLVFEPKLEGRFVWLSTRSGSFAPSATLPLGLKFKISLRPGLKDASGNAIAADLHETAETPPMRLKGSSVIGLSDSDNATATPHCLLLFNTDVDAPAAAKFIWWEDAGGKRVEAKVEQADGTDKTRRFYAWSSDDRSLATWTEIASGKGPKEEPEPEADETTLSIPKKIEPRHNVLFVGATKPLPPGGDWRLVLAEGLPSAEWKIGLPERKEVKLGAVQPFVLKSLDAETNLEIYRRITGADRSRVRERLEHFGLWERRRERVGLFSRGMKQKLAIARATLHRPALVFLDEPTAGLDPEAVVNVRNDIAALAREGSTVFLNTHNMADAEKLSDLVGVMRKGKLLAIGSPDELRARSASSATITGSGLTPELAGAVGGQENVTTVTLTGDKLTIGFRGQPSLAPIVRELVERGVAIEEVRRESAALEDIFLEMVREVSS